MDWGETTRGTEVEPLAATRSEHMNEAAARYRERLLDLEQKAQTAYDQSVFRLSGAAMGLSFVFVHRFVGDSGAHATWALGAAWISWLISLSCILVSHHASVQAMRHAARQLDAKNLPASPGGLSDRATGLLNTASGAAFVIGALLSGIFMISNIGGNQMSDKTETTMMPTDPRTEYRGHRVPTPEPSITTPEGPAPMSGSGGPSQPPASKQGD